MNTNRAEWRVWVGAIGGLSVIGGFAWIIWHWSEWQALLHSGYSSSLGEFFYDVIFLVGFFKIAVDLVSWIAKWNDE